MYLSESQNVCGLDAEQDGWFKVGIIETATTGNCLFRPSKQMYKVLTIVVEGINQ